MIGTKGQGIRTPVFDCCLENYTIKRWGNSTLPLKIRVIWPITLKSNVYMCIYIYNV